MIGKNALNTNSVSTLNLMISIVVVVVLLLVVGTIFFMIARSLIRSAANHRQSSIPVPAKVAGRRTQVWLASGNVAEITHHYATFEFANGQRLELSVPESEAGYMVEGDAGLLTYQGTRFVSFDRGAVSNRLAD
ncbi:MAG TPA: DUF2500 domain-containing protein [Clostridia bacterium]